ncbi:hypothetical protein BE20_19815 [Sorangium cellulosum]|uniref:Secreted protein n=1 Tax=Sorangium cellulosum TaxID=56 RepID=A0A150T139_SORCE|nr:hypothetical protein BE20_19815 [Sorangium cellulosum]KYF98409.1 hypothetical protein BE18_44820 [Sorangium cellulosum]
MYRRSFIAAALLGAAALVGCAPSWRVVTQASPAPFVGQRYFALMPIDFVGLQIIDQSEDRYLASKDGDDYQRFMADKDSINEEFAKALVEDAKEEGIEVAEAAGTTSAPFVLKPYVGYMNPGFYAVVSSAPSQIRLTLRITTRDGKVLDEVQFSSRTPSPIPNTALSAADADKLTMGGRWREDARVIGAYAARYLASRVDP